MNISNVKDEIVSNLIAVKQIDFTDGVVTFEEQIGSEVQHSRILAKDAFESRRITEDEYKELVIFIDNFDLSCEWEV